MAVIGGSQEWAWKEHKNGRCNAPFLYPAISEITEHGLCEGGAGSCTARRWRVERASVKL